MADDEPRYVSNSKLKLRKLMIFADRCHVRLHCSRRWPLVPDQHSSTAAKNSQLQQRATSCLIQCCETVDYSTAVSSFSRHKSGFSSPSTASSIAAVICSLLLLTNTLLPPGGFALFVLAAANEGLNPAEGHQHPHEVFRRQALQPPSFSSQHSTSSPNFLPSQLTIGVVMPLRIVPTSRQIIHHHRLPPTSDDDDGNDRLTIITSNATASSVSTTYSIHHQQQQQQQQHQRQPFTSSASFNLTGHLRTALRLANAELRSHHVPTELQIRLIEMAANPVTTSFSVCERLLSGKAAPSSSSNSNGLSNVADNSTPIYAVITGTVRNTFDDGDDALWPHTVEERTVIESAQLATASVSYTSGYLQIPVLSLARDSEFSDKNAHRLVLRILPAYSHQADVWVQVLKYFATTVHCRSAAAAAAAIITNGSASSITTVTTPKSKSRPNSSRVQNTVLTERASVNSSPSPMPKRAELLELPSTPMMSSIKLNDVDYELEHKQQPVHSRHYRSLPSSSSNLHVDSEAADVVEMKTAAFSSSSRDDASLNRLRAYSSSPPSLAPATTPYSYFYVDNDDDFYQTIATPFLSAYDNDDFGDNNRHSESISQRRARRSVDNVQYDDEQSAEHAYISTTAPLSEYDGVDDSEDQLQALPDEIITRQQSLSHHPYDLSPGHEDVDDDSDDDQINSNVANNQYDATFCSNQDQQQHDDEDEDYVSPNVNGQQQAAVNTASNGKARPGWTNVIVITSADADGRFLLGRLHSAAERNDIKIEDSIIYESGTQTIREQLYRVIASATSRVFLVHSPNLNDSGVIFHDAESLGLTGAHSVWLVSEQALASPYCPTGALGIRLVAHDNVGAQVRDAVRIVARALIDLVHPSSLSLPAHANNANAAVSIFGLAPPPPTSCLSSSSFSPSSAASSATNNKPSLTKLNVKNDADKNQPLFQQSSVSPAQQNAAEQGSSTSTEAESRWSAGPLFFDYLVNQTLSNGDTGFIKFDDTGDRLYANYDILNIISPVAAATSSFSDDKVLAGKRRRHRRANVVGSYRYDVANSEQTSSEKVGVESGSDAKSSADHQQGKMKLRMNINDIVWPGGMQRQLPRGYVMPSHLIASTIVESPFVYAEPVSSPEQCQAHRKRNSTSGWQYSVVYCQRGRGWTPADGDAIGEHNCCYGYCVDLLLHLSTALNFTFDLLLSPQAGASIQENITYRETQWTGIVGDLVTRRADIAVAPITITPERVRVIDFSKPFKYQGITIMIKKTETVSKLNSFLQPFHYELWLLVGVALHFVALALYLLDRFSPFGRYRLSGHYHPRSHLEPPPLPQQQQQKLLPQASINSTTGSILLNAAHHHQLLQGQTSNANSINNAAATLPSNSTATTTTATSAGSNEVEEYEEDALNLSSAMWFAWGVLLNSGIGEGTPRSFGGRVLGMVWAGFAMIMVASYTANLAAFLVLDRSQTRLAGINDPHLRNPTENITFATVKDSAVHMYFKRQVELSAMLRKMEKWNFNNADDAIKAVKSEELKAFIYDSSRLEYEAARDCELITVGELFGRSGYGVALPKSSPWTEQVSLHILGMHERGEMERLDKRWIETAFGQLEQCNLDEDAPATLGLSNMKGVFILIAVGIAAGLALIFVEISYKRHNRRRQREIELARRVIERWRKYVERKKKARSALFVSAQVLRARGAFIRHSQLANRNSSGSAASIATTPAVSTTGNSVLIRPLTSASAGNLIALRNSNADGSMNNAGDTVKRKANQNNNAHSNNSTANNKANSVRFSGSSGGASQPLLTKGWTVDIT